MRAEWLDRHTRRAPPALRSRVLSYAEAAPASELPAALAAAAGAALERVLAHAGDRSVALDLLAADALITLSLLAQAQLAPAQLEEFAAGLVRAAPPPV